MRTNLVAWVVLGAALLPATGCGDDPLGPEQEAFESALARWQADGPASYTYEYRLSCFCPPQLLETARVTVTDGSVTDVYLLDSDVPAPPDTYGMYDPIEGLFDRLASSLDADPVLFEASYDPDLGYPTSARVDISEQIADEEYSFTASGLTPAAP